MTVTQNDLRVTEFIRAPREVIFDAWTRPELMQRWFCPEGFSVLAVEADAHVGGNYRITMRRGDNSRFIAHGSYQEIIPHRKVVFTWMWNDPDAVDTLVTVQFEDQDKGTQVTLIHEHFANRQQAEEHNWGWTSILQKLAEQFS